MTSPSFWIRMVDNLHPVAEKTRPFGKRCERGNCTPSELDAWLAPAGRSLVLFVERRTPSAADDYANARERLSYPLASTGALPNKFTKRPHFSAFLLLSTNQRAILRPSLSVGRVVRLFSFHTTLLDAQTTWARLYSVSGCETFFHFDQRPPQPRPWGPWFLCRPFCGNPRSLRVRSNWDIVHIVLEPSPHTGVGIT
jgi:hypothetical protein